MAYCLLLKFPVGSWYFLRVCCLQEIKITLIRLSTLNQGKVNPFLAIMVYFLGIVTTESASQIMTRGDIRDRKNQTNGCKEWKHR